MTPDSQSYRIMFKVYHFFCSIVSTQCHLSFCNTIINTMLLFFDVDNTCIVIFDKSCCSWLYMINAQCIFYFRWETHTTLAQSSIGQEQKCQGVKTAQGLSQLSTRATLLTYHASEAATKKYATSLSSCRHTSKFLPSKPSTLFAWHMTYSTCGLQLKLSLIIIPRYSYFMNLLIHPFA